jgi:hypothetical protein
MRVSQFKKITKPLMVLFLLLSLAMIAMQTLRSFRGETRAARDAAASEKADEPDPAPLAADRAEQPYAPTALDAAPVTTPSAAVAPTADPRCNVMGRVLAASESGESGDAAAGEATFDFRNPVFVTIKSAAPPAPVTPPIPSAQGTAAPFARATQTDLQGRFAVPGVPPGEYRLVARTPFSQRESESPLTVAADCTLTPAPLTVTVPVLAGTIEGTVVDTDNRPVEGARVTVTERSAEVSYPLVSTTDRDGHFVQRGLGPGTFRIRAEADGFAASEISGVRLGSAPVLLVVAPAREGTVRVRSKATGQPVAGADVRAFLQPTAATEGKARPSPPPTGATTGPDGIATLKGLAPGTFALRVSAAGFLPRLNARLVIDGDSGTLDVELAPGDAKKLANETVFGGIGASLQEKEGRVLIASLAEGSPGATAGLKPGDLIDAIDYEPAKTMDMPELLSRIRGEPRTPVTLDVLRDGRTVRVTIVREEIDTRAAAK